MSYPHVNNEKYMRVKKKKKLYTIIAFYRKSDLA